MNYTNKIMVNFTTTPNHIIDNLSLKELGLFVYLNSKPTGWNFASTRIASHFNITHKTCLLILKSLEAKGYLLRERQATGRMSYTLTFDEVKQESQTVKTALCKKATVEKLHCVKIGQVSNNILLGNTIEEENIIKESSDSSSSEKSEEIVDNSKEKIETSNKPSLTKNSKEIIDYLNAKLNAIYMSDTPSTLKLIKARMNEGFTIDDFKSVIDKKYADWHDSEMSQYLRPATLFSTKFEAYLNSSRVKHIVNSFESEEYGVATDFS